MNPFTQPIVYPPMNHCIYCGETTGNFSNEHIIPRGLGGSLILPKSSCPKCSLITSEIERFCLRSMYGLVRKRLVLPSYNKKSKLVTPEIEFRRNNLIEKSQISNLNDIPLIAIGFTFPAPGVLRGVPPSEEMDGKLIVRYIEKEFLQMDTTKDNQFKVGTIQISTFCRMLAKIAFSYAAANLGDLSYKSNLPDYILGKNPFSNFYIGGDESEEPPEQKDILHDIYLQNCSSGGKMYLLVAIRLFAFIGMPRYHVVIGELI